MVYYKDYVAGWLDSSIHDFLEVFSDAFAGIKYALITCLDSDLRPASLRDKSPHLRSLAAEAQPLGSGLLVPTERLFEANASNQLLFGFDEIWFFPTKRIEPKPDSATLVGPTRIDQKKLHQLGRWMSRTQCSLALGDGTGLNFIVKAHGLARYLLGHSLAQPEPSAAPLGAADSA
jgi:hypothetical protein